MPPIYSHARSLPLSSLLLAALLFQACSFAPKLQRPAVEEALPEAFTQAASDTLRPPARWWAGYDDPVLNQLIDTVLVRNLDLAVAAARVAEVQQRYRISRSAQFPAVQVGADGNRQNTPTNTGATGRFSESIPNFPDRFDVTSYSASLGFSYEIDFWGRVRGSKAAALHDYFATEADRQTARLGILAETIATYFEVRDLQRQLALTGDNVALLAERLDLSQDRFERGLVTSFELYALQQEYEDTRASIPQLEAALYEATGRVALLMGTLPPEAEALLAPAGDRPPNLSEIPAGLPSALLQERPDVRAAAQRLSALQQQIGVARAERFPQFALTGSGGTQTSQLSDLLNLSTQRFWLFGGSLTAPLFNAGALRANERAAWARYEQQAATYEQVVLTAFKDTEVALKAFHKERERYAILQDALASAEASAAAQQQRFVRGVGDYVTLLDAQRNLLRARLSLATADRALANARLNIHRALGGAWVLD